MRAQQRVLGLFSASLVAVFAFVVVSVLLGFGQQAFAKDKLTLVYYDGHMHTTRSDGSGSVADIKATALSRGLSAVIITCVVSASAITLYGMRIIDKKADTLVGTVQVLVEELPALKAALPPALADAVSDERRPD